MGLTNFGLEKLTIYAYEDSDRSKPAPPPKDKCEVMFNPSEYTLKYGNEFEKHTGINEPKPIKYLKKVEPDSLELLLIFTDTGVEQLGIMKLLKPQKDVVEKVKAFLEITTSVVPDLHRPYHLRIEWGVLNFDCDLKSADIKFPLFDRKGKPLRADITATFEGELNEKSKLGSDKAKSPDVSHARRVREGDTLPLLCHRIYGDSSFYLKVAQVNQLNSIKGLLAGSGVKFPPIK